MATSSRSSSIFGIQDWTKIYQTFSQADFQSYDYETLRNSFINYLQTYYPETFNDYTESSEYIALLDVIAFMGQAVAFRDDLNTRENFIDTAQRRDSVIKLANLIGYNPKRNTAGQGWLKVTSISTTENVYDINTYNLANQTILWNDPANSNWQEQFSTILNAALVNSQSIGVPGNKSNILGTQTSEYSINIPPNTTPIVAFSATVNNIDMSFELVSVTSVNSTNGGVYEIPPKPTSFFNICYRNDNMGFASANTGFFFYFKEGSLQTSTFSFDQQVSNEVVNVDILGINNDDTWLFEVNNDSSIGKAWTYTDNIYGDATALSSGSNAKLFSVVSRTNDQVSYIFGDGVFAKIPLGNFIAYVRAGNALSYVINPADIQGTSVSIPYISRSGQTQTLTFTLSLTQPVTTAQNRESLANIKERAPARYYTQNRMVNGEDYTNFPYTLYNSIVKSTAINRTSVGVSRNLDFLDPSQRYSSTNSFADDGALYLNLMPNSVTFLVTSSNQATTFVSTTLSNYLSSYEVRQFYNAYYPRYSGAYPSEEGSIDNRVYWQQLTANSNSFTGYFYIISKVPNSSPVKYENVPIPIGTYSGFNMKYLTPGAIVKIVPPTASTYFDKDNRIQTGTPKLSTDKLYFWATIEQVVGDGYNNGEGKLSDGSGPVITSVYIPTGACISPFSQIDNDPNATGFTSIYRTKYGIIPSFDNKIPSSLYQQIVQLILLNNNFVLSFDNSLIVNQSRWSVTQYTLTPPANWFVNFISQGSGKYIVTYQSLNYYFGSVSETRFYFDKTGKVFDPSSGTVIQDYISVLATNTQPTTNSPLQYNVTLNIIGQTVESDGFVDDFEVEVSGADVNADGIIDDPDFFTYVTGYDYTYGASNIGLYVFLEVQTDTSNLARYSIVANGAINYNFSNRSAVEAVVYQFNIGQIFYARSDNMGAGAFYQSQLSPGTTTNQLMLVDVTSSYVVLPGRGGLQYQYRHNSPDTTRIDPGTTNIIDLYVVPQAYYTAYTNWLQDSTNTVVQPTEPTMAELQQAYSGLDDYKMISDSIVLNCVTFKPLFGSKAAPNLQGTIKVIPNPATTVSTSEIVSAVVTYMNQYFSLDNWSFGDTFYFSELSAYLHQNLADYVSSVVLVPVNPNSPFGDLYEVRSAPYEIFVNGAIADNIQVISALTPSQLQISKF